MGATAGDVLLVPATAHATSFACAAKADLWFGNDESGSVDSNEFDNALDFMYQISDRYDYDAATGVQGGVFAWDDTPHDIVVPITEDFGDTDDSGLIQDANVVTDSDGKGIRELYDTRVNAGGTNLPVATQHIADLINGGNGRRSGVRQVAIILTDATQSQMISGATAANWIAAADNLRAAGDGNVGIVLVLIAEAATAYAGGAKTTVDAVAGTNGLIVTVPTYADAADAAQGYIDQVTDSICNAINDDADNISAAVEDAGPNNGDGNNDGTPDSAQSNVTTADDSAVGAYNTTAVSGGCSTISSVQFYKEPNLAQQDALYDYPLGLHGFTVGCTSSGGTVNVVYYWDKVYNTAAWTYRKFNNNSFLDFSNKVTYGTAVLGSKTVTTVSYSITDGSIYDADGVANGTIVDPAGPTTASAPATGFGSTSNRLSNVLGLAGTSLALLALGYCLRKVRAVTTK